MKSDLANMLWVSKIMDVLKIQLPFDHTSVLLEYKSEVCLPKTKSFSLTTARYRYQRSSTS